MKWALRNSYVGITAVSKYLKFRTSNVLRDGVEPSRSAFREMTKFIIILNSLF